MRGSGGVTRAFFDVQTEMCLDRLWPGWTVLGVMFWRCAALSKNQIPMLHNMGDS